MKLKVVSASLVLAAVLLAQPPDTAPKPASAAPASVKVTQLGSATVYQLKDGQFVVELGKDRLNYYLLDQSAVTQGVGEKGLEIIASAKAMDKITLGRIQDDDAKTARLNYWHLKENGQGGTTGHPITHEAARRLTLRITADTTCQDVLDANRVTKIETQLSRGMKLPGKVLAAEFVQEQAGDGLLGPSDFKAFYALKVPVSELPAWEAALAATPVVNSSGGYAKPKVAQPWWVSEADFKTLKLHGPKNLTGWFNGWVGLSPDGRIFIYSFTM